MILFVPHGRASHKRASDGWVSHGRVSHGRVSDERVSLRRVPCCAQQTGMHILVVEALLIYLFYLKGRANTYRHKKTLSVEYLSRTCLAR